MASKEARNLVKSLKSRFQGVAERGPRGFYGFRGGATWVDVAKNPLQGAPGPPPLREKASFNTHSPKPGAMLDALTSLGPRARRIVPC